MNNQSQERVVKNNDVSGMPKYILILSMLYVICFIFPMMMAYRMVEIGPFVIPGGTVFFASSYVVGDIVTEVYGYQVARQLVWAAIITQLILGLFITVIIHLPYPTGWHHEKDFLYVLGHSLRYAGASSIGNFFGEFCNIYIVSKFKVLMKGRFFWLRSMSSSLFGEAVLTCVVFFITFTGLNSHHEILKLVLDAYGYKMLISIVGIFPAAILVRYLKNKESIDVYDVAIDFSPFKYTVT